MNDQQLALARSPLRTAGAVAGALVFVAMGVWMLLARPRGVEPGSFFEFVAWVAILFFGGGAVVLILRVFQARRIVPEKADASWRDDDMWDGEDDDLDRRDETKGPRPAPSSSGAAAKAKKRRYAAKQSYPRS